MIINNYNILLITSKFPYKSGNTVITFITMSGYTTYNRISSENYYIRNTIDIMIPTYNNITPIVNLSMFDELWGLEPDNQEQKIRYQLTDVEYNNIFKELYPTETEHQCSICFENYETDKKIQILQCKHHFCAECIQPWLNLHNTCPLCRIQLTPETD